MRFWLLLLCAVVLGRGVVVAQEISPFFLSNNNVGKDFFLSFPPAYSQGGGSKIIKVCIASQVETNVTVTVVSEGWSRTVKTVPNNVVDVEIPVTIAQPYFKTANSPAAADQIYNQKAVHVVADDPVMVYGATIFQTVRDGFLFLPTSALGQEYIVSSYAEPTSLFNTVAPSEVLVVSPFGDTRVTFTLGGNAGTKTAGEGSGSSGLVPGGSKNYTMNEGDVLTISSYGTGADLSGSRIVATKPVAVISGAFCTMIPPTSSFQTRCNYLGEQESPVHTWGKAYPVTKILGRQKNSFIKIVAKEANTQVYRNGQKIGTVRSVGGTVGNGFLDMRIQEGDVSSFMLTADKPISVTQYNPNKNDDNSQSEPFQMLLTPLEQFQKELFFGTPASENAKDFSSHHLNIIFELVDKDLLPEDIEIAKMDNGVLKWQQLSLTYGSFFDVINYAVDGKWYGLKTIELPGAGMYGLRANNPLAAYLYNSANDPYGCPASLNLADKSVADFDAPVPEFSLQNFDYGEVKGANVTDLPADAANRSNLARIFLIPEHSFNYSLKVGKFIPGQSRDATWALAPIDASKPAKAVVAFIDRAGNDTTVTVEFQGVQTASVEVASYSFGEVTVGTEKAGAVRITSTGGKNVVVTAVELSNQEVFTAEIPILPLTISPSASQDIFVRFQPHATGSVSQDIIFRMDNLPALAAKVTGTGLKPDVTLTALDFSKIEVNTSKNLVMTLRNNGNQDIQITSLRQPTQSVFSILNAPVVPFVLPANDMLELTVAFQPADTGSYKDAVLVGIHNIDITGNLSGIAADPSVGVSETNASLPVLLSVYPNPVSEEAALDFTLPKTGHVRVTVTNAMGQDVLIPMDGIQQEGHHVLQVRTDALAVGAYFCRIVYNGRTMVRTFTIVR